MLKLCRVTKVKVFFLVLVYVFNFDLFEFLAAILEKGLLYPHFQCSNKNMRKWSAVNSLPGLPISKGCNL